MKGGKGGISKTSRRVRVVVMSNGMCVMEDKSPRETSRWGKDEIV